MSQCEVCQKQINEYDEYNERNRFCRECRKLKQLEKRLSIVPTIYRQAKLTDFPTQFDFKKSYYFWSTEPGTGKTHLAYAFLMVNISENERNEPLFSTFGSLQLRLRATMNGSNENEEKVIDEFSNADLIVLDDLGGLRPTGASDYSLSMIFEILNHRYGWQKQTIITSNKSIGDIAQSFDARIASRLVAMCEIIELTGNDRRLSNGK